MRRIVPWLVVAVVLLAGFLLVRSGAGRAPARAPAQDEVVGAWVFDAGAVMEALVDRARTAGPRPAGSDGSAAEERRRAEAVLAGAGDPAAARAAARSLFAGTLGRFDVRGDGTASLVMTPTGGGPVGSLPVEGTWTRRGDRVTFVPRPAPGEAGEDGTAAPTILLWSDGALSLVVGDGDDAPRVRMRRP